MKRTILYIASLVGVLNFSLLATTTSRKAAVTCDFRPVAEEKIGFDALGKLQFDINLDSDKVLVTCLSKECVLDGDQREINLTSVLDKEEPVAFSEGTMPRMVLYGGNGDDTEFLVILNGDNRATLTLMVDSNIAQSSKPVVCEVAVK